MRKVISVSLLIATSTLATVSAASPGQPLCSYVLADGGSVEPKRPDFQLADGGSVAPKRPDFQLADGGSVEPKRPDFQLADGGSVAPKRPDFQSDARSLTA